MLSKGGGANIRYLVGNEGYAWPEYIPLLSHTNSHSTISRPCSRPDFEKCKLDPENKQQQNYQKVICCFLDICNLMMGSVPSELTLGRVNQFRWGIASKGQSPLLPATTPASNREHILFFVLFPQRTSGCVHV